MKYLKHSKIIKYKSIIPTVSIEPKKPTFSTKQQKKKYLAKKEKCSKIYNYIYSKFFYTFI